MKKLWEFVKSSYLKIGVIFTVAFTALYPKLPSIYITHTWVYIRLEDFLIAIVVAAWFVQLLRRKVRFPFPVGIPIFLYWFFAFLSFVFSLIFVGPYITNFFPKIAALSYGRRLEYMILFFVAFTTIKSVKDVRDYLVGLSVTMVGIVIYGFGQHYYLAFWHMFPKFFETYPFCFPSFQTGNEEFAKGIPLCLPADARATSTFAGHYDLAAYLVVFIPVLFGFFITVKNKLAKISLALLSTLSVMLLIFTSSRTSFLTYLFGIIMAIIFLKKKKYLIPVIAISIALLFVFNGSTVNRFLDTIRIITVVTDNQGHVIGSTQNSLPSDLQKKISKNPVVVGEAPPSQALPEGSSFINLPQTPVATSVAVVKNSISIKDAQALKLAYGGVEISSVSGSFLIQKALVYDISLTTRFQAEWPNAWHAFLKNPPLGSGFSTITLAADNDYLRMLGESGFIGLMSFVFIFIIFGIYAKQVLPSVESPLIRNFVLSLCGGMLGLFANALLIDVFEASKVAEPLWIFLGIAVASLALYQKKEVTYYKTLRRILTTKVCIFIYFVLGVLIVFGAGIPNFFVADDFTWLKWSAQTAPLKMLVPFVNAQGFFYRPIDKVLMYMLYTIFSFQPAGYHLFELFLDVLMAVGMYILGQKLFKSKLWAFGLAFVFILLPIHAENMFWIATISTTVSSVFLLYGVLQLVSFREKPSVLSYILLVLLGILSVLSYEMAIVFPVLIFIIDYFIAKTKIKKKTILFYTPLILVDVMYVWVRNVAHAVSFGGDYNYNLFHFLPNAVGNLIGYLGLFVIGEQFSAVYTVLRDVTRLHASFFAVCLIVLGVGIVVFGFFKRKDLCLWMKKENGSIITFAILFIIVATFPFLGLGNLTERYGYLASVGAAILIIIFAKKILSIFSCIKFGKYLFILLSVIVVLFWTFAVNRELNQWRQASVITRLTLGFFRVEHPTFPKNARLYIVNTPLRNGNAWIFPVGLPDGLWFIYRDDTLWVSNIDSLGKAKALQVENKASGISSYVFSFNKNGDVSEVKQ